MYWLWGDPAPLRMGIHASRVQSSLVWAAFPSVHSPAVRTDLCWSRYYTLAPLCPQHASLRAQGRKRLWRACGKPPASRGPRTLSGMRWGLLSLGVIPQAIRICFKSLVKPPFIYDFYDFPYFLGKRSSPLDEPTKCPHASSTSFLASQQQKLFTTVVLT